MNYGMYISASGAMVNLHRMDVEANNLANMETPGFKADVVSFRLRDAARIESGTPFLPSNRLLERLGAGVKLGPSRMETAQGALETTGRPMDIGLRGAGFLTVQGNGADPMLTRDGRLTLNARHELVMAASGRAVLDVDGKPITLSGKGPVRFEADGTIRQDGVAAGRLGIVTVADAGGLRKQGSGLLAPTAAQWRGRQVSAAVVEQGTLERSGVDPVLTTLEIGKAERAVTDNIRMIQSRDEIAQLAISTFGRVA